MKVFEGRQVMEFRKFMLAGIGLIFILLSGYRVDGDIAACNQPDFQCRSGSSISGCLRCDHEYNCPGKNDRSDETGCAQVDYSMALLWTSTDSTSGIGTLDLLYGDPDVFLPQLQANQSFNTSCYKRQHTPRQFTSNSDSVEVDYGNSNVMWTDQAYNSIVGGLSYIELTSEEIYIQHMPPVSTQVTGISFDWVSKLVYLSDAGYRRIAVYDASAIFPLWWRPVVDTNLTSPQDIVVYPNQNYLFWIDLDVNPKIERLDLASDIREVLISNGTILSPTKLAIDFKSDRLYWLDSNMATIGSCNLDGSNVSLWPLDLFSSISAFTFYRQYLFLGDRTRSLIHAFNESRDQVLKNFQLNPNEQGITDFATYDPSKRIFIRSPCTDSQDRCSHFCIKINATAKRCQCALGFFLLSDGRSCVTRPFQDNFLLVTDTWQQQLFQVDLATGEVRAVTAAVESFLSTAADYDYVSKSVYWFDRFNNGTIRQTRLTNGVTTIFVNSVAAEITSLAVDAAGKNLYYTYYFAGIIGIISLTTTESRTILAEPGSRPRVLVLDIDNRSLYWSDCATRSIEKAEMNNPTAHQTIVALDFCISALAIDALNGVIYWGDQGGNIESSKLDGSDRRLLYTNSSANYTGMTTDDSYLYIADYSMRQLLKLDRTSNKIGSLAGNLFVRPYAVILYNSSDLKKTSISTTVRSTSTSASTSTSTSASQGGVSNTTTIIVAVVICGSVFLIAVAVVVGILVARRIKRRNRGVIHDDYDNVISRSNGFPQNAHQSNSEGHDEMYTELDDLPNHNDGLGNDNMGQNEAVKETTEASRQSGVDNDYI